MKCNNACLCLNDKRPSPPLPPSPPPSPPALPKKMWNYGHAGDLVAWRYAAPGAHAEKAGCEGRQSSPAHAPRLPTKHAHALTKRPGTLPDSLSKCSACEPLVRERRLGSAVALAGRRPALLRLMAPPPSDSSDGGGGGGSGAKVRRPVPILCIGAPSTGKSALLGFISRGDSGSAVQGFEEQYVPTEKSQFIIHVVNRTTSLQIWEVTGRVGVSRSILSKAKAVVLFCDLSSRETFQDLTNIYSRFKLGAGIDHDLFPCVVCGTKLDLCFAGGASSDTVTEQELQQWAAKTRPLAEADSLFVPAASGSPSSVASPTPALDSRIKIMLVSMRTGAGVRPLIVHLADLAESSDMLASVSTTPTRLSSESAYGGSQLSHTSYDSSASAMLSPSAASYLSSSSPLSASAFPFSEIARRAQGGGGGGPRQPTTPYSQSPATPVATWRDGEAPDASASDVHSEVSDANSSQVSSGGGGGVGVGGRSTCANLIKIVLAGEAEVGKTSILKRFSATETEDEADERLPSYEPTVGTDCREVEVSGVPLQVWDTSGNKAMLALGRSIFRNAHVLVLVFDLSRRSTLLELDIYYNSYRQHHKHQSVVVLVGNKLDLRRSSVQYVRSEEGYEWLRKHNLSEACYLEASLLEPASLNAIFDLVTRLHAEQRSTKLSPHAAATPSSSYSPSSRPAASSLPRIGRDGGGGVRGGPPLSASSSRSKVSRTTSALPAIRGGAPPSIIGTEPLRSPVEERTCFSLFDLSLW